MIVTPTTTALIRFGAALAVAGITLTGCSSSPAPEATPTGSTSNPGANPTAAVTPGSQVLPVQSNPIKNDANAQTLKIDSVLVENNVSADGSVADDHLEIALSNAGPKTLTGFEVFYTFADPTTNTSESYYAKLPPSFTIPAGETRVAHFDNSGELDHFPTNKYSLYATSKNALDVSVTVSATGAAVQTATVKKDPGGDEQAD